MREKNKTKIKPMMAKVVSVIKENTTIKTFGLKFLKGEDSKRFSFTPGQFGMFSVPGIGEAPFSMCSPSSNHDFIEISVRKMGNVTNALLSLKSGDKVGVRGPYGHGYPVENLVSKNIIIVAGGIGFPPLASVVEHIINNRDDYGKVWVLYGIKDFEDLIYKARMKRWTKAKDIGVLVTVETPCAEWNGCVGVVTKLFDRLKIDGTKTVGLSCGPPIMLKFVTLEFQKMGISDSDIYVSLERKMQCGFGKCGHCNIGEKYVCLDGPVFSYSDIKKMVERVW